MEKPTPIEARYKIIECDSCNPTMPPAERFLIKFKGSLKLRYFWKVGNLYWEVFDNSFVPFNPDNFSTFELLYIIDFQNALQKGETIP
jgi:hypothetical protein